ncbi:MAG: Uncharacterized protein G01um10143_71 [Parcubacteria group bacterium Gr01-1014_3]|nr:MAG: Uncharacterized protein G01um10143_71 [Parcubacteria group bacterium Gr01-1014_3]
MLRILKKLFAPFPETGGLEIAEDEIRYSKLSGSYLVNEAVPLLPGTVVGGAVAEPDQLIAALKKLQAFIPDFDRDSHVVLTIPQNYIQTKNFAVPVTQKSKPDEVAKLNLHMAAPMPIDVAYHDYQILDKADDQHRLDFLGVYARKEIIDSFANVADKAGFTVRAVEFAGLSISRFLGNYGGGFLPGEAYAIALVKNDGLDMLLTRDGNLFGQKYFSWLRIYQEVGGKTLMEKAVNDSLLKEISTFFAESGASLGRNPAALILISEFASEKLTDLLLGLGIPMQSILINDFPYLSPKWYQSVGAALRGNIAPNKDEGISLNPKKTGNNYYIHTWINFIRSWRKVFASVLAFLSLSFGATDIAFIIQARTADQALTGSALVSIEEISRLRSEAESFNNLVNLVSLAESEAGPVSPVINKIRSLTRANGITIEKLNLTNDTAKFDGQAASEKNIVAFKDALSKDTAFSEVALPLSDIQPNSDIGFSFSLSFKVTGQ